MTYKDNQIANGKKWDTLLTKYKALGLQKDFEWIESQPSILKDIEAYSNSIKQVPVKAEKKEGK